jgi:hypothetical protein
MNTKERFVGQKMPEQPAHLADFNSTACVMPA